MIVTMIFLSVLKSCKYLSAGLSESLYYFEKAIVRLSYINIILMYKRQKRKPKKKPHKKQPFGFQPNNSLTLYLYRIKVLLQ